MLVLEDKNILLVCRVATVRENIWKMKFFQGQRKVREFCGWLGKCRKNLESHEKVSELENKWLWQAVFRKFIILYKREKDDLSHEIV